MVKKGIVIPDKAKVFGPMSSAINSSGYDILDFTDTEKFKFYTHLIVWCNKEFPRLETSAKTGWWMGDFRHPEQIFDRTNRDKVDYVFLCSGEVIPEYEEFFKRPVVYMPQCGFNPGTFLKPEVVIDWDVLFIGHLQHKKYHAWRSKILNKVSDFNRLHVISTDQTTMNQEYLYKNSMFNLSLTLPWRLTTSNRLYNILASGGFALVSYFPGIELLFENHRHLVWFKDEVELISQINYYKVHQKKREVIKSNGLDLYLRKHTAKHRIENMFDIMEGKETKFRGFL